MDLADYLDDLCDREERAAGVYFDRMEPWQCSLFLMEACRVMDYEHVCYFMARREKRPPFPTFDTLVRGWNPFLALALPRMVEMDGIPGHESTQELRDHIRSILYVLGSCAVVRKSADMLRGRFLAGRRQADLISLEMAEHISVDHFLDALEHSRLLDLDEQTLRKAEEVTATKFETIRAQMRTLVFPWHSGHGQMVGYGATEDVDEYFIHAVGKYAASWREQAGFHPHANLGATNGGVLAAVSLLLASFYLKHIQFVDIGQQADPATNYPMSLTIWKDPESLALSLAEFTDIPATQIRAALEVLSVGKQDGEFFASELQPYFPMLLRFADKHYVSPICSIFRNPLVGARMLEELASPTFGQAVREHRESWMVTELSSLFLGSRYIRLDGPRKLSRGGRVVTDVDWAVLDITTGELGIFQLKWQDYDSSSVRKQRSRARNFVAQVDQWTASIQSWVSEFGTAELLRALQIKAPKGIEVSLSVFAIGRSNARFASYGVVPAAVDLAAATWPQFVRLRHDIGPAPKVISELHRQIRAEVSYPVQRSPIPHEVVVSGQRILLKDIWSAFPESRTVAGTDPWK